MKNNPFSPFGEHQWLLENRKDASSPASRLLDAALGAVAAKMALAPVRSDLQRRQWLETYRKDNAADFQTDVKSADVEGMTPTQMLSVLHGSHPKAKGKK